MKKIIIIGSGGHAKACLDVLLSEKKFEFKGFIDNEIKNKNILGTDDDLKKIFKKIKYVMIGIGQIKSPIYRLRIFRKLKKIGFLLPVIRSSFSYVSKSAKIEEGTVIMHGAIINANAKIGKNTIINSKALIEHDAIIGDNCHISTNSTVNGGSIVGDNTFVGSRAVITNNIRIGKSKFIKAGSLIKKNII